MPLWRQGQTTLFYRSHCRQSKAATERASGSIDNYVTGVNEGSQRRYNGKGK
jgi:hypothetical protein